MAPTAAGLALAVAFAGTAAGQPGRNGQHPSGLTGQLLVATPELRDPRFAQTVIYMIHHDATGAMGLVVNRPLGEVPVADLLERLGREGRGVPGTIRVHYGGPVEETAGIVLHTDEYAIEGTIPLRDGIALTGNPEVLRAIADGKGPRRNLLAFGYAGWAPGQLEAEIAAGAWITVSADAGLVFGDDYDRKWERAMARHRIDL